MTPRPLSAALLVCALPLIGWINPWGSYRCLDTPASVPAAASPDLLGPVFDAAGGPFYTPIPAGEPLHPLSEQWVEALELEAQGPGFQVTWQDWVVPVYVVDSSASDPALRGEVYDVRLLATWIRQWNETDSLVDVRLPSWARQAPDGDGHMTVIDIATGQSWEFWQFCWDRGIPSAAFGASISTEGDGIYPLYQSGDTLKYGCSSKASGIAAMQGSIWPQELEPDGEIDHALAFSWRCTAAGGPVSPATGSDGSCTGEDAMPMGTRIRLDPALNLAQLALKPYEEKIARALQRYGMILTDTNGASIALHAVPPQSYPEGKARYAASFGDQSSPIRLPPVLASHLQVLDHGEQIDGGSGCYLDPALYD